MTDIQEVSAHVDVHVRRNRADVYYIATEAIKIEFQDIAAFSRALSIVKESQEYQDWLQRKGLA